TYNIPAALKLSGRLDVEALRQSLRTLIQRHDSLRMRFPAKEGRARARRLNVYDPLETIDLQSLAPDQKQARVLRLAAESAREPFDLAAGPLLRVRLLKTEAMEHILLFNMHHIISDGWSMGLLIRELGALYGARVRGRDARLPGPTIRYGDYAHWQRQWLTGGTLQQQTDYWTKQLAGFPELLELPSDRPRPARQSHRGATLYQRIPLETTAGLNRLGREQGATLYMILLAAFYVLLHRYTGRVRIRVGSPSANRGHGGAEDVIGFFVNTLVLCARIESRGDFIELLKRVRQTCLDAHAHQDIPFEQLVERMRPGRSMSHGPLFQVMFALQNAPMEPPDLPGLRVRLMKQESGAAAFDLAVSVKETENGLECAWEYSVDLFNEDRVHRMAGHYRRLLAAVVENPRRPVGLLPLLTAAEIEQQRQWNETGVEAPGGRTIIDMFEHWARRRPDAPAAVFESGQWSYAELNRRANQLAHYLLNLEPGDGEGSPLIKGDAPIGLLLERGPGMIAGLLAVLKADAAYIPLDPDYPDKRLAYMLEDSQAPALLTLEKNMRRLSGRGARVICLDREREAIEKQPVSAPARRCG
ncbi:MAG: AMP-binding protein, partial [Desulfobacterales bacterium]|nr:AMP-binding protein [Desulfobacterales bacterium]